MLMLILIILIVIALFLIASRLKKKRNDGYIYDSQNDITTMVSDMKACAFCAEPIRSAAIICRYCGKEQPADAPKLLAGNMKQPAKKIAEAYISLIRSDESKGLSESGIVYKLMRDLKLRDDQEQLVWQTIDILKNGTIAD